MSIESDIAALKLSDAALWARINAITNAGGQVVIISGGVAGIAAAHALLDGIADLDTLAAAPVAGDIIIANATPLWARLAANATATKKYLQSVSGGLASWQQIAAADISGLQAGANVLNAIPAPLGAQTGALTTVLLPSAATGLVGLVHMDEPMLLHSLSYNVTAGAVGTGHVVRMALYTETKVLVAATNVTATVGTATGVRTVALGADTQLAAGNYYAFICSQTDSSVSNCTIDTWTIDATFDSVTNILEGTVAVAAGAAPSPLGTITQVANRTPYLKLTGV